MELARQRYTFAQYVDLERLSPVKHEFLGGHVWAMAGGTPDHAAISANIVTVLNTRLRGQPCRVFTSDLRVRVKATGLGTYPDVSVVCDQLEMDTEDPSGTTVTNPRVVIEVLSPSTQDYDRTEKREHYQQVPSIQEIVLVEPATRHITIWRRGADAFREITIDEGEARLESIGVGLPLHEVYRDPLSE